MAIEHGPDLPGQVYRRFREAFPGNEGWIWQRPIPIGTTGYRGPCWTLQYPYKEGSFTNLYFRDEELGDVARIAGAASRFPQTLRTYLSANVANDDNQYHPDYLIRAEHVETVIALLMDNA